MIQSIFRYLEFDTSKMKEFFPSWQIWFNILLSNSFWSRSCEIFNIVLCRLLDLEFFYEMCWTCSDCYLGTLAFVYKWFCPSWGRLRRSSWFLKLLNLVLWCTLEMFLYWSSSWLIWGDMSSRNILYTLSYLVRGCKVVLVLWTSCCIVNNELEWYGRNKQWRRFEMYRELFWQDRGF